MTSRAPWMQRSLPYDPAALPHMRRLPGTVPLGDAPWLIVDDAFAGQMAERDRLVKERPGAVIGALPGSEAALEELAGLVLSELAEQPGYAVEADIVRRPDGVQVPRSLPVLHLLARLVQADLCVMEKRGDTHVLTAATLLFPAHWSLHEKLGRPLAGIHDPVEQYDVELGRRVQRLFDALHPDRPLWRFNFHGQEVPDLHTPATEAGPRPWRTSRPAFLRSERQALRRLPDTGAVVFSIHSFLVARADLARGTRALLDTLYPDAESVENPGHHLRT